jgi:hypothetical protein
MSPIRNHAARTVLSAERQRERVAPRVRGQEEARRPSEMVRRAESAGSVRGAVGRSSGGGC